MSAEQPLRWEEELLVASAGRMSWPATPDVSARVLARIAEAGGATPAGLPTPTAELRGRPRRRGLEGGGGFGGLGAAPRCVAFAAVALLVAAVLVVLSVPGTRTAVAEFFGLVEGYRIERVPAVASPTMGSASSTPAPTPTATLLRDVAQQVTLQEAVRRVGFEPALPAVVAGLEPAVYVLDTGFGASQVATTILRYPTFDLWQARIAGRAFVGKSVPEGRVIETPSVKGVAVVTRRCALLDLHDRCRGELTTGIATARCVLTDGARAPAHARHMLLLEFDFLPQLSAFSLSPMWARASSLPSACLVDAGSSTVRAESSARPVGDPSVMPRMSHPCRFVCS